MSVESPKISRAERKEALQKAAEKSLDAIQNQLGDLKKVGTNALIIGGIIVAVYSLTELFLPEPTKKSDKLSIESGDDDDDNETESVLWAGVKGIATSLLLALAKEKLMDLIEELTEKDAKPSAE